MRRDKRQATVQERRRRERAVILRSVAARRAALANMPVDSYCAQVRSIKERRAHARLRTMGARQRRQQEALNAAQQLCLLASCA